MSGKIDQPKALDCMTINSGFDISTGSLNIYVINCVLKLSADLFDHLPVLCKIKKSDPFMSAEG